MKKARRVENKPPVQPKFGLLPPNFLSGNIFDSPRHGVFGHIDAVSPEVGIEGWVLDCASPGLAHAVDLLVGGALVATVRTSLEREDIAKQIGKPCHPGFRFSPEVLEQIRACDDNTQPVQIALQDGLGLFHLPDFLSTVGGVKSHWVDQRLLRLGRQDFAHSEAGRLLDRLETCATAASTLAERPLYPLSDRQVGHIEGVHSAGSGALWFIGWMRRDVQDEFPAVIVDRRRFPSAGAVMKYERADLDSGHVGVIGFLLTTWKPSAGGGTFHIYFGENAELQVSGGAGTRVLNADEILSQFESVRNLVTGGSVSSLRALLTSGGNWLPNNARAVGVAAEAALDKVVIVPSFGAFVEGWAICPTRRVKGFALKIGDCILQSDPLATYFRERADLASVFPDGGLYTANAGFGAVLVGPVTTADIGAALLKVIFTDDSSSVHAVDARIVRRFNPPEDSAPLLRQWPALQHEPFMPALARAAHRDWVENLSPPAPVMESSGRSVLVMVLPEDVSNLRAQVDLVSRYIFDAGAPEAIVFLARRREMRSEALRVVNDLNAERGINASLWLLSDDKAALALLPHILKHMSAERFVFCDLGVIPTPIGWRATLAYLDNPLKGVIVFEVVDPHGQPDRVGGALGAACFGWQTDEFLRWHQRTTFYAPGSTLDAAFLAGLPSVPKLSGAARRLEMRRLPRLIELIDASLREAEGASA